MPKKSDPSKNKKQNKLANLGASTNKRQDLIDHALAGFQKPAPSKPQAFRAEVKPANPTGELKRPTLVELRRLNELRRSIRPEERAEIEGQKAEHAQTEPEPHSAQPAPSAKMFLQPPSTIWNKPLGGEQDAAEGAFDKTQNMAVPTKDDKSPPVGGAGISEAPRADADAYGATRQKAFSSVLYEDDQEESIEAGGEQGRAFDKTVAVDLSSKLQDAAATESAPTESKVAEGEQTGSPEEPQEPRRRRKGSALMEFTIPNLNDLAKAVAFEPHEESTPPSQESHVGEPETAITESETASAQPEPELKSRDPRLDATLLEGLHRPGKKRTAAAPWAAPSTGDRGTDATMSSTQADMSTGAATSSNEATVSNADATTGATNAMENASSANEDDDLLDDDDDDDFWDDVEAEVGSKQVKEVKEPSVEPHPREPDRTQLLQIPKEGLVRSRRGTIEMVVQRNGRILTPEYNNVGVLKSVSTSDGIMFKMNSDGKGWSISDRSGKQINSSPIVSVAFDKKGNLTYQAADGKKTTMYLDGSTVTE